MAEVGVVVVTFRSDRVLPDLLRTLEQHEPGRPIVIVDNASPGGPPDPGHAEVISLPRNLGYATACNAGAARLRERHGVDVLAFLNPDVRLRGPSLTQLAEGLDGRPSVGVATGPLIDDRGRRVPAAWGPPSVARAFWFGAGFQAPRLRAALGRFIRSGPFTSGASTVRDEFEVEGSVVGGAMLVRRVCFEAVGGFDPGYFMYGEDRDLCQRVRNAGWEVWVLPCEPMVHLREASSPTTAEQRSEWYRQGMKRYASQHLDRRAARRISWAFEFGRRLRRLRRLITGRR